MKNESIVLSILLFVISVCNLNAQDAKLDFPTLNGPYLGQTPPGNTPEIFAPGIISREYDALNAAFSPDGNEFFFTDVSAEGQYTIMFSRIENGIWTKPATAEFSGKANDADPIFSYDGKYFFFVSDRTENEKEKNLNVWYLKKAGDSWSNPIDAGEKVNSPESEFYPSVSQNLALYFTATYKDSFGNRDIYRSKFSDGKFADPVNIGNEVNTEFDESDVFVFPNEDVLIFKSSGRQDSKGYGDLYVSFKKGNNWTKGINLGSAVNTENHEYCPILSPDLKYLFFTRVINGNGNLFWVDASIIQKLKPKDIQ